MKPTKRSSETVKQWFIRTPRTYIQELGEVNDKPSETVPDEAISVPTLLRRMVLGQPLGLKSGFYLSETEEEDADHDQDDLEKLALADLSEKQDAVLRAQELERSLKRNKAVREEAARKRAEDQKKGEVTPTAT